MTLFFRNGLILVLERGRVEGLQMQLLTKPLWAGKCCALPLGVIYNFILQHFYLQKIKVECKPCIYWCCSVKYKGISAAPQGLQQASGGRAGWDKKYWRHSPVEGLTEAGPGADLSFTATAAWETAPAKARAHLPNEQVPKDQ